MPRFRVEIEAVWMYEGEVEADDEDDIRDTALGDEENWAHDNGLIQNPGQVQLFITPLDEEDDDDFR